MLVDFVEMVTVATPIAVLSEKVKLKWLVTSAKPSITTTATKDSPAGEYEIIVGNDGEASDYNIIPVNGKLIVEVPAAISTLSADGSVFDIYTTTGVLVKKDATSLKGLAKGVYIVNGKKVIVK